MPPRRAAKPKDPEQLRKEHEEYFETNENKVWTKIHDERGCFSDLHSTTPDMTDKIDGFLGAIKAALKEYKVKVKYEVKHEYVRCFHYGGGSSTGTGQSFRVVHDGVEYIIIKEDNDAADKIRHAFLDIYEHFNDDITPENLGEMKKKRKTLLKEFASKFDKYIKGKHHNNIHLKLCEALQKLRNALKANFELTMFDFGFQQDQDRKLNDFKYAALLEKWCTELQTVWDVLLAMKNIETNPPLTVMVAKFAIPDWRKNRIFSFFLQELYEDWNNLKKEMSRMYIDGEDYWKLPMGANKEWLDFTNKLIRQENLCELLMGTPMKRDQLNFMYNVVLYVFNSEAKQKLLAEEKGAIVSSVIPNLVVLRYLEHISKITQVKRRELIKEKRKREYLDVVQQSLEEEKKLIKIGGVPLSEYGKAPPVEPPKEIKIATSTTFNNLPTSVVVEEEKVPEKKERDTSKPQIFAEAEEDTPEDLEQFGRYWMWLDYFPQTPEKQKEILAAAECIRKINLAVRQDMADQFIAKGLHSHMTGGKKKGIVEKKIVDPNAHPEDKNRPPKVWNDPEIVEKPHKYRAHADPAHCYIDKRVQEAEQMIQNLAFDISNTEKLRWTELVREVIRYFEKHGEENPKAILTKIDQYAEIYP